MKASPPLPPGLSRGAADARYRLPSNRNVRNRSESLGGKVVTFDRCQMPLKGSAGGNQYETGVSAMVNQNTATNHQFLLPSIGRYDQSATKTLQKNEQRWPFTINLAAALEVTVLTGTGTYSGSTLTDATQSWLTSNQWASETVATGSLSVNGAVSSGATTIALTGTPTIKLRKDGLVILGTKYVHLSADALIGATSLSCYPLNGTYAGGETGTTIAYGGPTYWLYDPLTGRRALITSSTATTLVITGGNLNFSGSVSYEIHALYPLSVAGQTSIVLSGTPVWTDPLPVQIAAGTKCYWRCLAWAPLSGETWPVGDLGLDTNDTVANLAFAYSGAGAGSGTNGPYLPIAAIGDPVSSSTPVPSVIVYGDSKPLGTGDTQLRPKGWPWRMCSGGNGALLNLACGGEAGFAFYTSGHGAYREQFMQMGDVVIIGYGANDLLDTNPLTLAQMKTWALYMAQRAADAGVTNIIGVTIGPLCTGTANGTSSCLIPGNEGSQTVVQSTTLAAFDNWLLTVPAPFTSCFDVRNTLQLGGIGGTAGKWQTYAACATGTVTSTTNTTTLTDTALDTLNANAPFPQASTAQLQYQGCLVALTHSGTTYYQFVSNNTLTVSAGTLTVGSAFGATSTIGDTYSIYPVSTLDLTHPSAYGHKLLGTAALAAKLIRAS
jgi:lysophospholipase L1-like esterase